MYSRKTEIRHLSSADIYKLGQMLDQTNSWKKLMRIIPKDLSAQREPLTGELKTKYTNDHIKLIENASIKQNRMSTEILFDEWGTSGKVRPTIGNLLELLVNAELFRAADFVADLLNESPPTRPTKGPAARIDISLPLATEDIEKIDELLNDASCPGTNTLNENAEVPSEIINKDFYDKISNNEKKLNIDYSDMIKFSTTNLQELTSISSTTIPDNQLTETVNPNLEQLASSNTSNTNPIINSNTNIISCSDVDMEDIPILSALNVDGGENSDGHLPDLSALHVLDTGDNQSHSRSGSFGNSSSLSNNTDDGDILTPNLSILDQKSNDDSSLTNVTDTTSENISFEIDGNNENSSSGCIDNDPMNIPSVNEN